ncbi:hypothetical protein LPJ73_003976, partial [Coemansia sp. RSA 2703]
PLEKNAPPPVPPLRAKPAVRLPQPSSDIHAWWDADAPPDKLLTPGVCASRINPFAPHAIAIDRTAIHSSDHTAESPPSPSLMDEQPRLIDASDDPFADNDDDVSGITWEPIQPT